MSDEYTPTTQQIEADWISAVVTSGDYYDAISEEEAQGRWNRWLADHDERVKAEAWDHCLDEIEQNELNTQQAREGNPHRKEARR